MTYGRDWLKVYIYLDESLPCTEMSSPLPQSWRVEQKSLPATRAHCRTLTIEQFSGQLWLRFLFGRKYSAQQEILHNKFNDILPQFKNLSNAKKLETFLYGHNIKSEEFDCRNIPLTFAVQKYVLSTKRFSNWNPHTRFPSPFTKFLRNSCPSG